MTATKQAARDVYVATQSAALPGPDGADISINEGRTLVREGHWLLDKYPHLFAPVECHWEVEEATAKPGRKRAR